MTAPDKRRAMLVYLRDLVDHRMRTCGSISAGFREAGDMAGAERYAREQTDWHAVFLIIACLVAEYDEGQTGKYGVARSVTNIISAGAGAYLKTGRAA
jgi:hypothetical protein